MKNLSLLLFASLILYISSECAQQPTALQETQELTELQPEELQTQQSGNRKIFFNPTNAVLDFTINYSDNSVQGGSIYPGYAVILESNAENATKFTVTYGTLPSWSLPQTKPDTCPLGNMVGDVLNTNYFFVIYRDKIIGTNPLPDGPARDQQFKDFALLKHSGKNPAQQ